jgi:hypothetical protein
MILVLTCEYDEVVVALHLECFDIRISHNYSRVSPVFELFGFNVTESPRN